MAGAVQPWNFLDAALQRSVSDLSSATMSTEDFYHHAGVLFCYLLIVETEPFLHPSLWQVDALTVSANMYFFNSTVNWMLFCGNLFSVRFWDFPTLICLKVSAKIEACQIPYLRKSNIY